MKKQAKQIPLETRTLSDVIEDIRKTLEPFGDECLVIGFRITVKSPASKLQIEWGDASKMQMRR